MTSSTLLIVEDSERTRKWEAVYFDNSVFRTDFAANANEAIDKLEGQHYDYAVIDVMLPVTSGLDLSEIINKQFPETKVILCSAIREFDTYKDYHGIVGYIEKPLYPYKVEDIIRHG